MDIAINLTNIELFRKAFKLKIIENYRNYFLAILSKQT
jgi:hypothetical protein